MKNARKIGNITFGIRFRTVGIATLILVLTVLTVLSMRGELSWVSASSGNQTQPAANGPKQRPLVTVNDEGKPVVLDRQTGQNREMSQDESRRLAEGLKQILNDSTEGLVEVVQRDGTVSIDLKGHFHNAMVVRKEADGRLTHSCINDLRAAAAFFDIDPQLLGVEGPVTKSMPAKAEER